MGRLLFVLALPFCLLAAAGPVIAQEQPNDANLPSWAAPREQSRYAPPSSQQQTNAPTMPSTPEQVPIDGGLGLLAAAGAGYAAYKLRRRRDEEDNPDSLS